MNWDEAMRARVREVIERTSRTQLEFAAEVGLEPSKLSRSLNGRRRFTSLELALIAERGEVTLDWLLHGVTARTPATAARSQDADVDGVASAVARAGELDEISRNLANLGYVADLADLPAVSSEPSGAVAQGERLAAAAMDAVEQAGRAFDVADRLADVVEDVFGVNVAVENLPSAFDGLAWTRGSLRLALVTNQTHWTRQRFTLAHELGHILASDAHDRHIDADVMAPRVRREADETRANAFAATLLMPAPTVRAHCADGVDRDLFLRLLGDLRVSASALAWRLVNLGLIDDALRQRLGAVSVTRAALEGGWAEEHRALVNAQQAVRPPMLLVQQAFQAYVDGQITVRPLATVLGVDPDVLLDELTTAPPLRPVTPDEPIFVP